MTLFETEIFKKLFSLQLPTNDFAIFGSGPMFVHGLRPIEELRDLDLIARNKAWDFAKQKGETILKNGWPVVHFFNDQIEIFNGWGPGDWDINKLIDEADVIEGIKFVKLDTVLSWKKQRYLPKDEEHIRLIEKYFESEKL